MTRALTDVGVDDGVLAELPSGWTWRRLGDLADVVGGVTKDSKKQSDQSLPAVPYLRVANVQRGRLDLNEIATIRVPPKVLDTLRLQVGDVLLNEGGDRDKLGRGWVWQGQISDCIHQNHVFRARVRDDLVNPTYLSLATNHLGGSWCERNGRQSVNLASISLSKIRLLPVPVAPRREQDRIVEVLEDHLSRLDAADRGLVNALQRSAALRDAKVRTELTGGVTGASSCQPDLPDVGVDDGYLPALPPDWSWRRLHELADVVGGVTKDAKRQSDPTSVEVPYLRVANVQRGRLDLSTVTSIRVPPSTADKLRLRPGDVLLNEGGDRDKLGRGWVWEGQIDRCIHQNHVFRARVRDGEVDPYLLSWAANSFGGHWCERNGRQSVNLASISLSKIKLMPLPVPPRDQQVAVSRRIRELLDASVRLEREVTAARQRGSILRRALLTAAFSGRLT